jgi:hypothetical protein
MFRGNIRNLLVIWNWNGMELYKRHIHSIQQMTGHLTLL